MPSGITSWLGFLMGITFYILFFIGLILEVISVALDTRRMLGKPGPSGAFGVAMGLFALFAIYGVFLSSINRVRSREEIIAWGLIAFQFLFHVILPFILVYCKRKECP